MEIKSIIPDKIKAARKQKVHIIGEGFIKKVTYNKVDQVITEDVPNKNGKGFHTKQRLVKIDDQQNTIIEVPQFIINTAANTETSFKSSSLLEVEIELPKETNPGEYIIFVVNPDGTTAESTILVENTPDGKITCVNCGKIMPKPIEIQDEVEMKDYNIWKSYICPHCGYPQQIKTRR